MTNLMNVVHRWIASKIREGPGLDEWSVLEVQFSPFYPFFFDIVKICWQV
jgi:hypothetical protein